MSRGRMRWTSATALTWFLLTAFPSSAEGMRFAKARVVDWRARLGSSEEFQGATLATVFYRVSEEAAAADRFRAESMTIIRLGSATPWRVLPRRPLPGYEAGLTDVLAGSADPSLDGGL